MIPPYRYERPYDPPPPPELIDALADKPLAPEIVQCETCTHLSTCRATKTYPTSSLCSNYAPHRAPSPS